MARPGGKEVGRVRIRAVPDGSEFRRDLKVMLDRAERTTKLSVPVEADVAAANSQMRRFQREWNGQKVSLAAAVGTLAAASQLRFLTRPRIAPIIAQVSKASVAKALALLGSLSGASLLGDIGKSIEKTFLNLGSNLPKIALVATSVASIVALTLTSLGGLATLAGGLNNIFGILVAAPGILTGLAVGGTALGLALADTSKQLAVLGPRFRNLQKVVSNDFWAVARRPIIDFVRATLPELTEGLRGTSTAVGGWASSVVQSFQTAFGGGRITAMFAPLIESVQIASTGALGFAQILAVLGQVGGSYLPRLAQWVADLSNRFGAFLLEIEQTGQLQALIEGGITATKLLGSALYSIGSILAGVAHAAETAGGGGLATFASVLAGVAAIVNSPTFQTALSTIFTGAAAGASGLASALGPIGELLSMMAPLISGVLTNAGQVIGSVLGQIAAALQQPAFQTGLALFFEGLLDGILAIGPALPALAAAFGTFLGFVGRLAQVLGPLLSGALVALAPVFDEILAALLPVLPILGDALLTAIQQLSPSLLVLVQALAPLLPQLAQMVVDYLPEFVLLLQLLAAVLAVTAVQLKPFLDGLSLLTSLTNDIASFGLALLGGADAASVVSDQLSGKFGPVLQAIAQLASGVRQDVLAFFGSVQVATSSFVGFWSSAWTTIGSAFTAAWNGVLSTGRSIFNSIIGAVQVLVNSVINAINGLTSGFRSALAGVGGALGINLSIGKIPNITLPRLSVGADVLATNGGVAALLGEGGRAERVIDRGLGNRSLILQNKLAERVLALVGESGGEGQVFNITPPTGEDPRVTARAWAREYRRG